MYSSLDVPAKVFYKVLSTGDVSLLGHESEQENTEAFDIIYDLYFSEVNNAFMKVMMKSRNRLVFLNYKITVLSNAINFIATTPLTTEDAKPLRDALLKMGVQLNQNSINQQIGILRNEILAEENAVKEFNKGEKSSFEARIVWMENVLGRSIDDNITLAKDIELEKSANLKIKENGKRK